MHQRSNRLKRWASRWLESLQLIAMVVSIIWCIALLNHVSDYSLSRYGIVPREVNGLIGVLTWVLLHGNLTHLLVNTTPLLFLGYFVALLCT